MHDARPIATEAQLRALIPAPSSKVKLEILMRWSGIRST